MPKTEKQPPHPRTCGFRLSVTDIFVSILGVLGGIIGYRSIGDIALVIPFVIMHFFLFCNVFRVRRKSELVWAGIFIANCAAWLHLGNANILGLFGSQFMLTIAIIVNEIRQPCYHGVLSKHFNKRTNACLAGEL